MEKSLAGQRLQTYRALSVAAERMGAGEHARQLRENRGKPLAKFTPTPEHTAICKAMAQVAAGTMDCETAMAMLWEYETMGQRLEGHFK